MLGKASEIKTEEMWHSHLDDWLNENPDFIVIDIKYALGNDEKAAVLVIYKEASL